MGRSYRILLNGRLKELSPVEGAKENLRHLLNTFKGERKYFKEIGESLNEILFRKISPELIQGLKSSIMKSIQNNLPLIDVKEIDVNRSGQYGESFFVRLLYQVKGEVKYESFEMELSQ